MVASRRCGAGKFEVGDAGLQACYMYMYMYMYGE